MLSINAAHCSCASVKQSNRLTIQRGEAVHLSRGGLDEGGFVVKMDTFVS
jgi:hypothetical protein